jgi:hypothetical protein
MTSTKYMDALKEKAIRKAKVDKELKEKKNKKQ